MNNLNSKFDVIFKSIAIILALFVFVSSAAALGAEEEPIFEAANYLVETTVVESSTASVKVLNDMPILFINLDYELAYDLEFYTKLLKTVQDGVKQLKNAINSGDYTSKACNTMSNEIIRLNKIISKIDYTTAKIRTWEKEHYYATKVWEFFTSRGYSEVVTSAILGNMMIETSGGTLNLKPIIYDPAGEYYGLCQWSLFYKPEVTDLSFTEQLEYLEKDMVWEFNTFGSCYASGFTYEDFLSMENPEAAALAFAKSYERCASFSYTKREIAAREAYEYFKLDI